jgi:hypothetical protein
MKRVNKIHAPTGMLALALLFLTAFVASCGSDDPAAPGDTNGAPSVPAINTGAGAPADNATAVDLAVDLDWTCSDPDDDDLTYTVRFGTAAEPPTVEEDQVPSRYTPAGLVHGTTYYWQIIASDGARSSTSPVWSFTTVAVVAETVTAPGTPDGPAGGEVDDVLAYTTSGGVSSDGHALEYRFDWDDGTRSAWSASVPASHAWALAGTYAVTAQARCSEHPDAVSSESVPLQVVIEGPENVTMPSAPTGPQSPEVDVPGSYAAFGATSSRGHTLQYRLDWGDGTYSDWAPAGGASHAWTATGDYDVRAQARCQDHPGIESVWSVAHTVTVLGAETVSTPDAPSGAAAGATGETLRYDMTGAASSHGHDLDVRFDWGNGVITAWTSADWGATHWNTAGAYEIKVQARCRTHASIESDWSPATTVTITEPGETVSVPTWISGPASTVVDDPVEFRTYNASSNVGHTLEYRFDWGDGTYSDWVLKAGVYAYGTHAWTDPGTYQVRSQARCQEHPDVMSDWSTEMSEIVIAAGETVPTPTWNGGLETETTVDVGWWLPALTRAQSSVGHTLEWYVDFGDGTFRDWNANSSFSKRWLTIGDYTVRARARCQDHPDILSDWSADLIVHVVDLETIDGQPTLTGPTTATVGVPAVYSVSGVVSSHGHELEYQLYDSYNDQVPGVAQGWTTADNMSMTWDAPGTRVLQVNARCVDHPDIDSVMSFHLWVTITE